MAARSGSVAIRALRGVAVLAVLAGLVGVGSLGLPAAGAATAFPGNTRSHYLTGVASATLRHAGRVDARDARQVGIGGALVILDAGSPAGSDGSTRLPDTGRVARPDDIAAAAVAYGKAWRAAHGPPLVLVVGTTNYGRHVGAAHGRQWGRLVAAVASRLPAVDVRGGFDIEMEFGGPRATLAEVRGFLATTRRGYVDFGSCTCPPRATTPGGWTVSTREAAARGGGRGVALPEVYATGGGNAQEWAALVGWSRRHHPHQPLRVVGVLTEVAACSGPPRRPCAGIDVSPESAWSQLAAALGGSSLRYASDIGYLPHGGAVHGPLAPVGGPAGLAGLVVALLVVGLATATYVLHRRGRWRPRIGRIRRPRRGARRRPATRRRPHRRVIR